MTDDDHHETDDGQQTVDVQTVDVARAGRPGSEWSDVSPAAVRQLAVRSVAHRVRTPLSVVLGPIHAAAHRSDLDEQLRRQLEVALEQAELVLEDLDELSEVGAWPDRPELVPVRLGDLVTDVALERLSARTWQGLTYTIDADDTADVVIDPAMARWAIDALLRDALAGCRRDEHVALRCRDDGDHVVATIRVCAERRSIAEHLGVATLVAGLFGGTIDRSRTQGAPSFELRLPAATSTGESTGGPPASATGHRPTNVAATAAPPTDDPDIAAPDIAAPDIAAPDIAAPDIAAPDIADLDIADLDIKGPQGASLVLVVEDDPVLRDFLTGRLALEHRVATSTSAEDAVAIVERVRPDLFVCDLQLPGAGGEHLVRQLRSDPDLAGIPVVVVSGRNDEEQRIRLLRAGIDDYVSKPFSPDELVARISNLLAKHVDLDDLRERASRAQQVADQLQRALESRIVIEQAKAFVAADRQIDVGEAFEVLRRHARSHNVKLHELAAAVVEGFRP